MTDQEAEIRVKRFMQFCQEPEHAALNELNLWDCRMIEAYFSRDNEARVQAAVVEMREACAVYAEDDSNENRSTAVADGIRSLPAPKDALDEFERKTRQDEAKWWSGNSGHGARDYPDSECSVCRVQAKRLAALEPKGGV